MEDQATTATADQPQSGEVLGNEGTNDSAEQVETSTGTAADPNELLAGAGEEQDSSEDADWLPDEQQKVFPDEVVARYANSRYPEIVKLLENDPTNGQLRQLLHDKVNTDIMLARQKAEPEVDEVETKDEPVQETAAKPIDLKSWDPAVTNYIKESTDVQRAAQFSDRFIGALQAAASEGATPEQKAAPLMAMRHMLWDVVRSGDLATWLTVPGVNGGKSLADSLVESHLTGRDPGFYDHLGATAEQRIWDTLKSGNAEFKNAPGYDSAEFKNLLVEAEKVFPGLRQATWKGKSEHQNRQMRAQVVLNHFAGKKVSVPEVKQALETGQKLERAKQQKVAAGRVTGAGQSKGNTGKPDDRATSFRESILRFNQENKPLSTSK